MFAQHVPSLLRLPSKLHRRTRRSRMATLLCLLVVLGVLLTPFYFIYKPPRLIIRYFQRRWPDVLWEVQTSKNIVALTIDDAPSQYTLAITQELEANGAHATFFVIGSQAEGREGVLQDLVRGEHELGNHAMHDEPSRALSDPVLTEQVHAVRRKLRDVYAAVGADPPPDYFRPGSGFFSDRMRRLFKRLDFKVVLGSIYPHDPQIPYWRMNARHILSMLRPGAIIICHDRRAWTVPMLKALLPEIKRRGYRVVTITELLEEGL